MFARAFSETAVTTTQTWEREAACRRAGVPTELFFSEDLSEIAAAKRICAECPVMSQCLEQAIHNEEPWGVWGGQLFLQGVVIPRKRPRGRPRKNEVAA